MADIYPSLTTSIPIPRLHESKIWEKLERGYFAELAPIGTIRAKPKHPEIVPHNLYTQKIRAIGQQFIAGGLTFFGYLPAAYNYNSMHTQLYSEDWPQLVGHGAQAYMVRNLPRPMELV